MCALWRFLLNWKSFTLRGEVSERFKEHAWKACVGEILPWVQIPPSPPRPCPLECHMILRTVEQVRRVFRIVAGFTLLLVGGVMLVTPGPGWLVIFLGLGLLAAEFVWAERLMKRIKHESGRVKDAVWPPGKGAAEKGAVEPGESAGER